MKLQTFEVPEARYAAFLNLAQHTVELTESLHQQKHAVYSVEVRGDILALGLLSVFAYAGK